MLTNAEKSSQSSCSNRSKTPAKTNELVKAPTLLALTALCMLLSSVSAQAALVYIDTFAFESFTPEGLYYDDPGLDIYVDIFDLDGRAYFEFHNESTFESSIAGIYFERGNLAGITAFDPGPGTVFQEWATPHNLPAAQTLDPVFETAYNADSDPATSHNGINPGEQLGITFDLDFGTTVTDLTNQLSNADVRIGLHIIALPDGSSFSMVTTPEPATIFLLTIGALILRRKQT